MATTVPFRVPPLIALQDQRSIDLLVVSNAEEPGPQERRADAGSCSRGRAVIRKKTPNASDLASQCVRFRSFEPFAAGRRAVLSCRASPPHHQSGDGSDEQADRCRFWDWRDDDVIRQDRGARYVVQDVGSGHVRAEEGELQSELAEDAVGGDGCVGVVGIRLIQIRLQDDVGDAENVTSGDGVGGVTAFARGAVVDFNGVAETQLGHQVIKALGALVGRRGDAGDGGIGYLKSAGGAGEVLLVEGDFTCVGVVDGILLAALENVGRRNARVGVKDREFPTAHAELFEILSAVLGDATHQQIH
jgi:hypothetical protein